MRAHAQPTPLARPGRVVIIVLFVWCNFPCVWVVAAVKRACSHHRVGKQATRCGATQLVAPPRLRCFPGNSRSGWQTR